MGPEPSHSERLRRVLWSLGLGLSLTVAGCASDGDATNGTRSATRRPDDATPLNAADLTTPSRLAGLEMRRYIIESDFEQAGQIILALEDPAALMTMVDPDTRDRLAANDIRVHAIPTADLDRLVRGLPTAPVSDETWLGVLPDWRSIHSGPQINAPRALRVNEETTMYEGGKFRLLLRAFPRLTERGEILRLECVPQFHQPQFNTFNPDPRARNLMGHFVAELAFAAELDGKVALLLTTEDRTVDWELETETDTEPESESGPDPDATTEDSGSAEDSDPTTESDPAEDDDVETGESGESEIIGQPLGPEPPVRIKTLGEELMASDDRSRRLIMLLVPVQSPDLVVSDSR